MSEAPTNARRAELASRLLVAILAGLFLLGLAGFAVAVLDARDQKDAPAPPSLSIPALAPGAAAPDQTTAGTARGGTAAAREDVAGAREDVAIARVDVAIARGDVATARGPRVLVALAGPSAEPSPTRTDPTGTVATLGAPPADPAAPASPSASDLAGELAPVLTEQSVPIVPVTGFWSDKEGLTRRELVRALETGQAPGFRRLIVEEGIRDALATSLGVDVHADVQQGDLEQVGRVIRRGGLALVAATDLAPSMRPLAVDGRSLVGNERVHRVDGWPIMATLLLPDGEGWDQSRTWVLVAGGDGFTDRGVYDTVVRRGKGVDFPFDGGTARVTGHGCCDPVFNANPVPRYVLTGGSGAVRRLFKSADLAIANHEMPVTEAWAFHSSGLRFSGKPELTEIFTGAGIDWMSLANNHIKDYGTEGIADSRRILRRYGLAFGGAGKDLAQARQVSYLDVGPVTLAIIPCVGVAPFAWADDGVSGGTPCLDRYLVRDIKEAKRRADVVVVFPHWGVEYTRQPPNSSRQHALKWVRAGADLVLGSHSHVAGAIEEIEGVPVLYSMGNLIFDQHWSTNTMESMLVEATFNGDRLASLKLWPYIIHDMSQPNLLDEGTGEGRRLRREVRAASADWLDW